MEHSRSATPACSFPSRALTADSARQDEMAREGWSVREAERRVADPRGYQSKGGQCHPADDSKTRSGEVLRVEDAIRNAFGTEVHLCHPGNGGKIEILYSSAESWNASFRSWARGSISLAGLPMSGVRGEIGKGGACLEDQEKRSEATIEAAIPSCSAG